MRDPNAMAGQQAELSELLAETKIVTLSTGKIVPVRAFLFRELAVVARLAMPIVDDMIVKPALATAAAGTGATDDPLQGEQFFLDVIERHGPSVDGLLALCTGLAADYIAGIDAGDGIDLVSAMFEVNARFFTKALPLIVRLSAPKTPGPSSSSAPAPSPSPAPPATLESAPGFDSPTV